jgi:hypothetical protein
MSIVLFSNGANSVRAFDVQSVKVKQCEFGDICCGLIRLFCAESVTYKWCRIQ